jgi:hypothetical protein
MIILNYDEQSTYNTKFVVAVKTLNPGTYFIKDFFGSDPSVPRIAKKFYEDVVAGLYPNVSLVNKRSREGYVIRPVLKP